MPQIRTTHVLVVGEIKESTDFIVTMHHFMIHRENFSPVISGRAYQAFVI
jgi:hypothetical protein